MDISGMIGVLTVSVSSVVHNDTTKTRQVIVYRYRCLWASAQEIADEWKRANPDLVPSEIAFNLDRLWMS